MAKTSLPDLATVIALKTKTTPSPLPLSPCGIFLLKEKGIGLFRYLGTEVSIDNNINTLVKF